MLLLDVRQGIHHERVLARFVQKGVCSDSVLNPTLRTGSVGRRLLS